MVLADLGRKITSALRSLSNATVINEEVSLFIGSFVTCMRTIPARSKQKIGVATTRLLFHIRRRFSRFHARLEIPTYLQQFRCIC